MNLNPYSAGTDFGHQNLTSTDSDDKSLSPHCKDKNISNLVMFNKSLTFFTSERDVILFYSKELRK